MDGGVLYYPGSGTDYGPFRLFAEHGGFSTFVYADYGMEPDNVSDFLGTIPGWKLVGAVVPIQLPLLGCALWEDFWPDNAESRSFHDPAHAFARQANLQSKRTGSKIQFLFLATESIQTYGVLVRARKRPSAVVLQDHGFGKNWASFGDESELFHSAMFFNCLPKLLLVAKNTPAWPGFEKVSRYAAMAGQMHGHSRAIFERC